MLDKLKNRLAVWCFQTQTMQVVREHVKVSRHQNCSKVPTCCAQPAPQPVIPLSSGESEFYELVNTTSAGLGAVSMLKCLGVDISENKLLHRQYCKSEVMRPLVAALQYAVESGGPDTLQRQRFQQLKDGTQNQCMFISISAASMKFCQ